MLVREFQRLVDAVLPPKAAMYGDAIGLQIASKHSTVARVLVCLDVTEEVVREAIDTTCDTILTFHPLIFSPLDRLDRSDRVSRCVSDCIAADISVISVHTSYDALPQGTNHILATKLGLSPLTPLVPNDGIAGGMGLLASCAFTYSELLERVSDVCGGPVRHCPSEKADVRWVAIVAGSGMPFFNDAVRLEADVFITADVKYHAFHAARGVIGLMDPGHFEMEQFVPIGLIELLSPTMPSVLFVESTVMTNPVQYSTSQMQKTKTFSSYPQGSHGTADQSLGTTNGRGRAVR